MSIRFSVVIQARNAAEAVTQVRLAETAGVEAAWSTIGGAGGDDPMVAFAAALAQTEKIVLGTAILQTWPRHPIVIAQQAAGLDSIAPGRFRLGVGPAHEGNMAQAYGVDFSAPLTNLREYLTVLTELLHDGNVDFAGKQVTARTRLRQPVDVSVFASALRPRSFELCGELSDGAISWMCPRRYLVEQALPAIRRGAERAGRPAPPLVAHVPVAVVADRAAACDLMRAQLGNYARTPFYQAMFEQAGYPGIDGSYPDDLLDDLLVSGDEPSVAAQLRGLLDLGFGEVLVHPVVDPDDREGSIARGFSATALAGSA